jgi:succinate dehydrogenase hydrophobic anchor subunit
MPPTTPTSYTGLVSLILEIINILISTIFGVIFLFLIWKLIDAWIINAGDEKKREEGRRYAGVAVIIFVVMVSVWGIVALLRESFFGV